MKRAIRSDDGDDQCITSEEHCTKLNTLADAYAHRNWAQKVLSFVWWQKKKNDDNKVEEEEKKNWTWNGRKKKHQK